MPERDQDNLTQLDDHRSAPTQAEIAERATRGAAVATEAELNTVRVQHLGFGIYVATGLDEDTQLVHETFMPGSVEAAACAVVFAHLGLDVPLER